MAITITKPISIYPSQDLNGQPTKRLVIAGGLEDLASFPDELFAVKISQSKKPDLAGKTLLKYISYKLNEQAPWASRVPESITIATPTSSIKQALLEAFKSQPDAKFQLTIKLPGKFANLDTPQGRYTLFDFTQFPSDGNPGYFLKPGTVVEVTLTPATHNGNDYFRVALKSELGPDEIFSRGGRGKLWGDDDEASAPSADAAPGLTW